MSKNVASHLFGLVLSILLLLASPLGTYASAHEEASAETTTITSTDRLQNPLWVEAPLIPEQDSKRLAQFALDRQLVYTLGTTTPENGTFYWLVTFIILLLVLVLGTSMKLLKELSKLSDHNNTPKTNYNKINASLLFAFVFLFFGSILYEISIHSAFLLPESASVHGKDIDLIMWITTGITGFVFIVTQFLLFYFAYKYQHKAGQKAIYYPKNDKLELLWTTVPAITLTALVLFGFRIWVDITITNANEENSSEIEMYAYRFGWKFRYPGPDGKLGRTDYRLTDNELADGSLNSLGMDITDPSSADDIVKDELILPKGVMVKLRMRSRDVLHAALLPHFRAQMYCVPGTPTQFNLEPLYTTEEFRKRINKPEFNFELACNQICGVSHYAMKREIVVVEYKDYMSWMNTERPFLAGITKPSEGQLTLK